MGGRLVEMRWKRRRIDSVSCSMGFMMMVCHGRNGARRKRRQECAYPGVHRCAV